jgi:hypothetical protein
MRLRVFITVGVFLIASGLGAVGQEAPPDYKPIRQAGGRRFPESERTLGELRDHPTPDAVDKMRAHAWDLFVGLTSGEPVWQTWYTKCDVRLAVLQCPPTPEKAPSPLQRQFRNFEVPVQSLQSLEQLFVERGPATGPPGATRSTQASSFQTASMQFIADFREHPEYASVLFNKEAANRILAGFAGAGEGAPFPKESIVLKTVWEVIHPANTGTQVAGPISTWKSTLWNKIHSDDRDPSPFAKHKVMIDTTPGKACEDRDYDDSERVPLACFYFHQLTADDIKFFPVFLAEIDDQHLVVGDYLILVGMHVATRELPEWVWATFWWENHSRSDRFAKGRPASLEMKWRHFLMDTTLSGLTPREKDGGPKICFNPYLETDVRIANGIISNCIQCHSRAGYGVPRSRINGYEQGVLARDGKTLANGSVPDLNYFNNFHKTDFLWSLVPQQDATLKDLLRGMQLLLETKIK